MKYQFKDFLINSKRKGLEDDFSIYEIEVKNIKSTNKVCFEYCTYIETLELETREETLKAFASFIFSAVNAKYTFEEFCNGFGYDQELIESTKCYEYSKECEIGLSHIYQGNPENLVYLIEKEVNLSEVI